MINLILPFCILHYSPSFVVSFFMLACVFICVFGAFLFELPFPSLSHIFFSLFFLGGGGGCLISTHQFISSSPFISLLSSPPSPAPISSLWMPFLPLPAPPVHTHTPVEETWHGYIKAGWSLFQTGRAQLVSCVIANANALAQEHWLFSQFFCWRIYMKNIKRLCGLSDPDHFQQQSHESTRGSLRQIILLHPYFEFSGRWKFNRKTIYLQAFPRWWFQQLHAEGSTLCGPAAQLAWPSFLSCVPYLKWEEKKTWSWENTAVWFQQKLEE